MSERRLVITTVWSLCPRLATTAAEAGGVRFAMGEVRLSLKDGKTIISYRICSHAAIAMATVNAKYAIGRGCCKN